MQMAQTFMGRIVKDIAMQKIIMFWFITKLLMFLNIYWLNPLTLAKEKTLHDLNILCGTLRSSRHFILHSKCISCNIWYRDVNQHKCKYIITWTAKYTKWAIFILKNTQTPKQNYETQITWNIILSYYNKYNISECHKTQGDLEISWGNCWNVRRCVHLDNVGHP